MELHMINIIYAAMPMSEQTKKTTFSCKMTSAKLYIYIGVKQGTCSLTKHTWRWAYSLYFFPACCLLRFAAFFLAIWVHCEFLIFSCKHTARVSCNTISLSGAKISCCRSFAPSHLNNKERNR